MKSKLIILFLFLNYFVFGQVPNTNTFSLIDVKNELGLSETSSLQDCFAAALDAGFDSEYKGSKDRLSNFRNYGAEGWFVSTSEYKNKTNALSETYGQPSNLYFKPDGTVVYMIGYGGSTIISYDLSTAWDITTIGNLKYSDVNSDADHLHGLFFNSNGTVIFILEYSTHSYVRSYLLSTAWDITTINSTYNSYKSQFEVTAQENYPVDLFFKPDGTKFYIGGDNRYIYEYSLSKAWDITTSSYTHSKLFSSSYSVISPFFKSDGFTFYCSINSIIYQYSLSTAWDITTVNSITNFNPSNSISGIWFKFDGTILYINHLIDQDNYIYRYKVYRMSLSAVCEDALLPASVGSSSVNVTTGSNSWVASVISGGDWLTISGDGTGRGNDSFDINYSTNETGISRHATIKITSDFAPDFILEIIQASGSAAKQKLIYF